MDFVGPLTPTQCEVNNILVMVGHSRKRIEFVVLPQNLYELVGVGFWDHDLAPFGGLAKGLTN